MPKIYIDDKEYEVKEGKNLLEAVLALGLNLPYFCWHPQLGSVGACRQCAVKHFKDSNDKKGRILITLHGTGAGRDADLAGRSRSIRIPIAYHREPDDQPSPRLSHL